MSHKLKGYNLIKVVIFVASLRIFLNDLSFLLLLHLLFALLNLKYRVVKNMTVGIVL